MTEGEYRAELKKRGLTPYAPSYDGAAIHVDRNGHTHSIPDPGTLTPAQRAAFIEFLDMIVGQ